MRDIAPNMAGGFDIAVLTHKRTGEALRVKVLPISESAIKSRLLIISNNKVIEPLPVKQIRTVTAQKKLKRTTNRKKITFNNTVTYGDKSYRINNGKGEKKLGLYVETLQRIIEQFEIASMKWRRVFVLRFELHIPYETKDNKQVTDFRKRLVQKLKREYGFSDVGYCWAREYHGKGKGQHYHWALFLDGGLIRHSSRINEIVRQLWSKPTGGYVIGKIERPYYFVDSDQIAQEAICRVSYLAKTRGKGHRPAQTKDFQCSRMKLAE
jgi:hypothetical protein